MPVAYFVQLMYSSLYLAPANQSLLANEADDNYLAARYTVRVWPTKQPLLPGTWPARKIIQPPLIQCKLIIVKRLAIFCVTYGLHHLQAV